MLNKFAVVIVQKATSKGFNPLNPKVKIKILIYRPYSFTVEVVGRSW